MIQTKGIKFPLHFHGGRVAISSDEKHIKESVLQIIGTNKLEYIMLPFFGSNIGIRVFDPVNIAALSEIDVSEAIRRFEPRVKLTGVSSNLTSGHLGKVQIDITILIKGETEPTTLSAIVGS